MSGAISGKRAAVDDTTALAFNVNVRGNFWKKKGAAVNDTTALAFSVNVSVCISSPVGGKQPPESGRQRATSELQPFARASVEPSDAAQN